MYQLQTQYREMIKDAVDHCTDEGLLDLVYKLLISAREEERDAEIWKDIEGYDGFYQVSNQGRVKSLRTGRILKTPAMHKSYCYLRADLCRDGKQDRKYVHRLVAQAFIPNPENKPQVNHINNNKTDNRAANLEWVSASENVTHSYRFRSNTDETRHHKKLTKAQIKEIQSRYAAGASKKDLAAKFGVTWFTIHRHCTQYYARTKKYKSQ